MKRLHLHVSVPDIAASVPFYATLFGAGPTVLKDDYAKWMLDDPRVNFAISQTGRPAGVDHVGIQVESRAELAQLAGRLKAAGEQTIDQEATTCCYHQSDKSWVSDPAGGALGDLLYLRRGHPIRRGRAPRRCPGRCLLRLDDQDGA